MLSAIRHVAGYNLVFQQLAAQRTSASCLQHNACTYCSANLNFFFSWAMPQQPRVELHWLQYL